MKLSFKRYLIKEGGKATAEWRTERALPADVKKAVQFVSDTIGEPLDELVQNLLGTSRLTYFGKKSSSGDIDIAVNSKKFPDFDKKMQQSVSGQGQYNTGTKVGSYAVDVGNGKKVQVDLMSATSVELAKFMYHSSEGENSKYPGAVRNIMLMTLTMFMREDGKDFIVKVDDEIIARASRSLKLDTGLERLFKVAKKRKDGEGRVKSLDKVSPDELELELKTIDPDKIGKFEKDPDIISNPDKIAQFFFGKNVTAKDIMTAEDVSKLINEKFKGERLAKIKDTIKKQLKKSNFPVPSEL